MAWRSARVIVGIRGLLGRMVLGICLHSGWVTAVRRTDRVVGADWRRAKRKNQSSISSLVDVIDGAPGWSQDKRSTAQVVGRESATAAARVLRDAIQVEDGRDAARAVAVQAQCVAIMR
jgi:hypothetical protein